METKNKLVKLLSKTFICSWRMLFKCIVLLIVNIFLLHLLAFYQILKKKSKK